MFVQFHPKESINVIEQRILRVFRDRLNLVFKQATPAIKRRLAVVCDSLIARRPEYASLINGQLMAEFGLTNPQARLDAIVNKIKEGIQVRSTPVKIAGSSLEGGIAGEMLQADFADLLTLSEAKYVSLPSGETIPWLDWLLTQGDQILVFSHRITYDLTASQKARSRSGQALMIVTAGQGWRVPPEASGTEDDNFLTRAFNGSEVERILVEIIISEIESRI